MTLTGKDAAHFIMGYLAALTRNSQRIPKYIMAAAREARDILEGGSFRGPLAVYEMERVANKLAQEAAIKASKKGASQ